MMTRVEINNNNTGIFVYGMNAVATLAQSTVTGNQNAYLISTGGIVETFGDNYVRRNAAGESGATPVSKQ